MKYETIRDTKHYVYDTEAEFARHHPDESIVSPWQDAAEGDWVLSDDGRIVQILKRGDLPHPHDNKNYKAADGYVRTIVGSFRVTDDTYMDTDFDSHKSRYSFSKTYKDRKKRVYEREKLTKDERQFAVMVSTGRNPEKALAEIRNRDPKGIRDDANRLLKQERVRKEIARSVRDTASYLGLDDEYVLRGLKEFHEKALDEQVSLRALLEIGKALGTTTRKSGNPSGVTNNTINLFQGFNKDHLEQLDE